MYAYQCIGCMYHKYIFINETALPGVLVYLYPTFKLLAYVVFDDKVVWVVMD